MMSSRHHATIPNDVLHTLFLYKRGVPCWAQSVSRCSGHNQEQYNQNSSLTVGTLHDFKSITIVVVYSINSVGDP